MCRGHHCAVESLVMRGIDLHETAPVSFPHRITYRTLLGFKAMQLLELNHGPLALDLPVPQLLGDMIDIGPLAMHPNGPRFCVWRNPRTFFWRRAAFSAQIFAPWPAHGEITGPRRSATKPDQRKGMGCSG